MPANLAQQGRSARRTMVPALYGVAALEQWHPISRRVARSPFLHISLSLSLSPSVVSFDLSRLAISFS